MQTKRITVDNEVLHKLELMYPGLSPNQKLRRYLSLPESKYRHTRRKPNFFKRLFHKK